MVAPPDMSYQHLKTPRRNYYVSNDRHWRARKTHTKQKLQLTFTELKQLLVFLQKYQRECLHQNNFVINSKQVEQM